MEQRVKSLYKALKLLSYFDEDHKEIGVTELAEYSGMLKSSVHNIMRTFEECGYVIQNSETRKYMLGGEIVSLFSRYKATRSIDYRVTEYLQRVRNPRGNGLSDTAYYFMAGIMKHIKAITAIANPLVNSYKRLVEGYEAPVHIAWACRNRSPLIRIPDMRGSRTHIELRSPNPTANPYLLKAACLKAGLEGIKNKEMPPEAVTNNIYKMSKKELKEMGIDRLPKNLNQALKELDKDELIKEAIGEHIYENYRKIKKKEWKDYISQVSEWELTEYLAKY